VPLVVIAVLAFAVGFDLAGGPARSERRLVTRYMTAWRHGDFAAMYGLLDARSQAGLSAASLRNAYVAAASTATVISFANGRVSQPHGNVISVPILVRTRIFGTLRATLEVTFTGSGSGARVSYGTELLFPGLRAGQG